MDVTVVASGRFSLFDAAHQLCAAGQLRELYTTYPSFAVDPLLRPHLRSFPWVLAAQFARRPWRGVPDTSLSHSILESLDRWAARRLKPCDILLHSWRCGLRVGARAKEMGARVVLHHGTPHIEVEDEMVQVEQRAAGVEPVGMYGARLIRKQLAEYAAADLILVPSHYARETFIDRGVAAEKVRAIPYGIDAQAFRPVAPKSDRFQVLYVGRMAFRKGVHLLLEAISPLADAGVDLKLIGPMHEEMRPWFERYRGRYTYLGALPKAELAAHYSQAHVTLVPSLGEGFGAVILQSMACGTPVIATRTTGGPDVIDPGRSGLLIPAGSAQAIRDAVEWLRARPQESERMGEAALAAARTRGWARYGSELTSALSSCVGKGVAA